MAVYKDVIWVKSYKGHDSTAQNSIWHCIKMLSNFEEVKTDIDGFDEKSILKGEKDFYTFMETLYQDMYKNPDKYIIPSAEYDEYMDSIDVDMVFSNEHRGDVKESKLRIRFQQAIKFYPDYFYQLGLAADELCKKTYALIIQKTKFNQVLKKLEYPQIKKENALRLNVLADIGIGIKEINNKYYISCKQHSKMFLGLSVLTSAPESKFKYLNYLRLDYKKRLKSKPEIEDIKMTLENEHSDILNSLLPLFDNPKTRYSVYPLSGITSSDKWKVDFSLEKTRVFGFYAGPGFLSILVFFKNIEHLMQVINTLEKNNPELFEWFRIKFRGCDKRDCPRNKSIMFGNQKKNICGWTYSSKVEIVSPNKNDVKKCITLIKMGMT